jgi:hypothetical protein
MHAIAVLQKCFADVFAQMHAARVQALLGAVRTLLDCRRLVLMDLARAWRGEDRVRTPLKRLDRLLSNAHLYAERMALYAQLARWLVCSARPIIVVDWSTLKADESWHLLRAALAVGGRTLTLYEEVHPQRQCQSSRVHRHFLQRLQALLPAHACPVIVTDAGFRCPWFAQVQALGWHWVGRVRNQVCVRFGEEKPWQWATDLLDSRQKLRIFGAAQLVRRQPFACQLLRYRQDRHGRKHRTLRGRISRSKDSRAAARSQREPWLLAYSDSLRHEDSAYILSCYRQRMQIELSFRDLKCDRYGCAFAHSLTRKGHRLAILLLLHALASFLAWPQGLALEQTRQTQHCCVLRAKDLQRRYSIVRIGWESLRRQQPAPAELHCLHPLPAWLASPLGLTP